jgi:hypothetical protein
MQSRSNADALPVKEGPKVVDIYQQIVAVDVARFEGLHQRIQ